MDANVGHETQVPAATHCRFHHQNSVPPPPHHHHFHVSPHCPFHSHLLHLKNHSLTCPIFASSKPQFQNPETLASVPCPGKPLDLQVAHPKEPIFDSSSAIPDEKTLEMEVEEEEEEDDPVFVLTDEWREFFAKSEAKRRLAKKQARNKGKNRMEK